jgi:MGT family glycosyltransferase
MKIVIPTLGTRGDIQPYIALALGLQRAGHQVTLSTHPVMGDLVTSYGIPFAPMGPEIDIGREAARIRENARHWLIGFRRVMKFSFRILEEAHDDLLAVCRGADLVVVSHTAAGKMEADKLDLPTVSATLIPQAIPARDPEASIFLRAAVGLAGAGMGLMMTRPLDRIRRRVGLPPMGPEGITSKRLNLVPVSPQVVPRSPLWEDRHKVTGYWYARSPEDWQPPADLREFLEAGDPPVVVSLGAMSTGPADREVPEIFLQAFKQTGLRGIFQGWHEVLEDADLPESIYHAGSVPHDWLLQRARGMIHHGGFGSTAAGFRAGIPSMAVPHIIDQYLWGGKIAELGVGPEPIPAGKLTVEKLAAALERIRSDQAMREKAADLGEKIRAEEGVQTAVALIEDAMGVLLK